jgi:catechol 2,3-dioxygenase-like lactoylglutathione lyase family enzyme
MTRRVAASEVPDGRCHDGLMTTDTKGTVAGLHHIQLAIPAGEEEQCRRFWGDLLGMTELDKPEALAARGGCWFTAGNLELHLGVEADFSPARKAHPGILTNGLTELAAKLAAAGATVSWDDALSGYDRFHTYDPFGNRLEFLQPAAMDQRAAGS